MPAKSPNSWNPGDVILDLYKVKNFLGEGGFGKVYQIHHQGWNIDLAVKIPKPEIVAAAGGLDNFEREAETWVNLGLHPHIVSCYYVRRIESNPLVFAEYVAGGSLYDWIYDRRLYAEGRNALERILDIAIQFAWGLHYAHEQGLIHQDLKPANVMMTPQGMVKVTDFGLAKALTMAARRGDRNVDDTLMTKGSGAMTPTYCSPEQANRETLTRRTDLWSWALSVLTMFTGLNERGGVYWPSGSIAAYWLENYLQTDHEDSQLPQMPAPVAELLKRCFQHNPDARPHDMMVVANELKKIHQQVTGEIYLKQQPDPAQNIADNINNRAVSLFDLGKEGEALQLWKEALNIKPQHPEATYNHGLVLWRRKEINDDVLIDNLLEAIEVNQENWTADYLLSLVFIEQGSYKLAIKTLENVQKHFSSDIEEVQLLLAKAKERLPDSSEQSHFYKDHIVPLGGSQVPDSPLYADSYYTLSFDSHALLSEEGMPIETLNSGLNLWNLETGQCQHISTEERSSNNISCFSLSADNRFIVAGIFSGFGKTESSHIKLWETSTGRFLYAFESCTSCVTAICISHDNHYVLSGHRDYTLKLWDLQTGRCLNTFYSDFIRKEKTYPRGFKSVCLSEDNHLAMAVVNTGYKAET